MRNKFNIIYTKEKNWFVARCIEIDIVSQGRTIKSAERNITEAIQLYIDSFGEPDLPLQKSKPLLRSIVIPEYAKTNPDIRRGAYQVSAKARISNGSAKGKPRLLAKKGS
jgi:predicted RNase H-like HicB family nuclease